MRKLTNPTPDWGPALVRHRREAERHTRKYKNGLNFEIDPWGQEGPVISPNDVHLQVRKVSFLKFPYHRGRFYT